MELLNLLHHSVVSAHPQSNTVTAAPLVHSRALPPCLCSSIRRALSLLSFSALFLNLKDVNFVLCEGDVVIVEDDDKNAAGKGRNLQFLRDIGNVVRRNHPKNNDPAKRALMCTTR
ncbi:hypothetical protein HID58_089382 [Brassica napus]|uniref:Uncharacterized protein n=1 Tax=Brassica napus TaxID=3708 RepID=A0ABQ7XYV1_BRANA|nr:hypothetical protein HID58_089382 [Brassica napus]